MAGYWDYRNSGTGYWDSSTATTSVYGGGNYPSTGTASSTSWTSTSTNTYYVPTIVREELLVEAPAHWSDADNADFVQLVNDETDTGWTISMVIKGDIAITDPRVGKRPMADFVPLLKHRASKDDRATIDKFFVAHPLVAPEVGA